MVKLFRYFLPLLFLAACAQADVPIYDIRVVNTYPHSTNAFTQGLLFHDGYLYEGTGRFGQSSLSRINLEDGAVVQNKRLANRYFGEGIAIVDQRIFQLTWQSNIVFEYDLETFANIESHYHPTEGWGLTYDGSHLILSDGSSSLQFIDPKGFQVVREVDVTVYDQPLPNLNELEYIDGEVWANVWMTNEIVRIDPADGKVLGIIDLAMLQGLTTTGGSDDVLNGIAWDPEQERIFVTGKLWADLFEIELVLRE